MKVFFVLTQPLNPTTGGVQHSTFKLGKYLHEQNIEVYFFSFAPENHIENSFGYLFYPKQGGLHKQSQNITYLLDCLLQVKPDVVINQMPYLTEIRDALQLGKTKYQYLLLACLRNTLFSFQINAREELRNVAPKSMLPVLTFPPVLYLLKLRNYIIRRRHLKNIIDIHDYYILLTEANRKELRHYVGDYKQKKIISIPNSIPAVLTALPKKEKIILYVGSVNTGQKRSELLLDVWKAALPKAKKWKFVIVGDGPYLPVLQQRILDEKIPEVEIIGRAKPDEYYARASIFFMTSAYEGFPNVIIEAQSFGAVPVAFNSYSALEYIVTDQKDALLVKPFDATAMANTITSLINEPCRLQMMQVAALNNARKYHIDKVGKIWLDLFMKTVGEIEKSKG